MAELNSSSRTGQPLAGRRIIVTRARGQAASLIGPIEGLGASVIEFPTIEIQPPESFAGLDDALKTINDYDWLVFTSANSIQPFCDRLYECGLSLVDLKGLRIAAIGPQTAQQLRSLGLEVALVPERYQAEGILEAVAPESMSGKKILIPRAAKAREVLPETLRQWGATVTVVTVYRTVVPAVDVTALAEQLRQGQVDMITFTSSSTVSNFCQMMGGRPLAEVLGDCAIACIGPITADTVVELGGRVAVIASKFTGDGLVEAIVKYLRKA